KSEAEISKAANISDLVIVNPPTSGSIPIYPNKKRNYMVAFIIGIFIPIIWIVVAQSFNNLIQTKQDIEALTTIPIIEGIGHLKNPLKLEVLNSPKSIVSESFRSLRANLRFFVGNKTPVVIVVTSSI
ncbi:MAG: capsular biosynthesis protein, partial [Flammeovirgaceae bacterium]